MVTPEEAVAAIDEGHREVLDRLAGIPLDQLEEPATIGGGEWSAKDLVGHLTTWEEIALATLDEWRAGERPRITATFAARGTDRLNADEVARKSGQPVSELLRRFDEVHDELCAALRGISPEEWLRLAPHATSDDEDESLASVLGGVLGSEAGPFRHFAAHERDLLDFSGRRTSR
jgi:hypothetical protein